MRHEISFSRCGPRGRREAGAIARRLKQPLLIVPRFAQCQEFRAADSVVFPGCLTCSGVPGLLRVAWPVQVGAGLDGLPWCGMGCPSRLGRSRGPVASSRGPLARVARCFPEGLPGCVSFATFQRRGSFRTGKSYVTRVAFAACELTVALVGGWRCGAPAGAARRWPCIGRRPGGLAAQRPGDGIPSRSRHGSSRYFKSEPKVPGIARFAAQSTASTVIAWHRDRDRDRVGDRVRDRDRDRVGDRVRDRERVRDRVRRRDHERGPRQRA
jgi:hypothetical protein